MTEKRPYSYTTLRYVHDVVTGEFINVGVVLYAPIDRQLLVKTRKTISRIKDAFPDLERKAFQASMRNIERRLQALSSDISNAALIPEERDASALARSVLPSDDSSLQWAPGGGGLTENPHQAFDRLYERLVARYDSHVHHRRTDEDIWKPVRDKLAERDLSVPFESKEIVGRTDVITFDHAWKNGVWHAYAPVSLDLADADGIKDKARRWLGHLSAVADAPSEAFKVYFILGKPQAPTLMQSYEAAKLILERAPGSAEIFEEDAVEGLVSQIEDEYRVHTST